MAEQNPQMAIAQTASRQNKIALSQRQNLSAHQPGVRDPAHHRHGDIKAAQPRPEDGDNRQHQHQKRKGQHDINNPHYQYVDHAAEIASERPQKGAEHKGEQHAQQADLEIDPCAPQHAGKEIATKIVGAEEMPAPRRQQAGGGVLGNRIERRYPRCQTNDQ